MQLHGKTAIVTGEGRRLGAAIAEALAGHGCNLLIHYHASEGTAADLARRVLDLGVQAHCVQADLPHLVHAHAAAPSLPDLEIGGGRCRGRRTPESNTTYCHAVGYRATPGTENV